ncbi:MAG TPA: hypothetical protein VF407_21410, partial [Polyangiaceae bacterium]
MKKNTFAWFVTAGAAIAFSGMGMAACSSSSDATGNPSNTGGSDSGAGKDGSITGDGGGGSDSGKTGTDGGGPNKDGGTCSGSAPFIPEAGTANYCFGARSPEDAGNGCSGTTPSCCDVREADGGFANSCVAQGSCVGVGTDGTGEFQCQDNGACSGGMKCCISKYDDWDGAVFDNTCGKFY